jgi:hypothetical protein
VFSTCGGAAIYRLSALGDVGQLDGDFFTYLSTRMELSSPARGLEVPLHARAVAYYVGGGTNKKRGSLELFHTQRNNLALVVKNYSADGWSRTAPASFRSSYGSCSAASGRGARLCTCGRRHFASVRGRSLSAVRYSACAGRRRPSRQA